MDTQTEEWMGGFMDEWIDGQMDGRKEVRIGAWTERQIDKLSNLSLKRDPSQSPKSKGLAVHCLQGQQARQRGPGAPGKSQDWQVCPFRVSPKWWNQDGKGARVQSGEGE